MACLCPSDGPSSFTIAEFRVAVQLLPGRLQPRLAAMHQYATSGKPRHAPLWALLAELFALAATMADHDVLAEKTAEAERLWTEMRAEAAERHALQMLRAQYRPDQWKREIRRGYRGQLPRWADVDAPLVAATDASRKGRRIGWGYAVSDGRWGLRHCAYWADDPTGPSAVLVNELRAVHFLLSTLDTCTRLRLLVDNREALHLLGAWQDGDMTMPGGYDLRPRAGSQAPTLVRLARRVARMPHLSLRGVRAHRGHPLNEAAHSLSVIARRADRSERGFEVPEDMAGMVDRFLTAWHRDRPLPQAADET